MDEITRLVRRGPFLIFITKLFVRFVKQRSSENGKSVSSPPHFPVKHDITAGLIIIVNYNPLREKQLTQNFLPEQVSKRLEILTCTSFRDVPCDQIVFHINKNKCECMVRRTVLLYINFRIFYTHFCFSCVLFFQHISHCK